MQYSGGQKIVQSWRVQITPARYVIDNLHNLYEYTCVQKINCNSVNVLNFSTMAAFPNLNQFYSSLRVRANGVEYQIKIPESKWNNFWNIFDMCTIVKDALNSQTPHLWTVNTSGNNNRFVLITCNTTFNLVRSLGAVNNHIFKYLGFSDATGDAYRGSPQLQFLSNFPYDIQVSNFINLQIKNVGTINSDSLCVLVQIPSQNAGTLIHWQSPFYDFARQVIDYQNPYPVQKIQISFLDDQSLPLVLLGNSISMTLLFERFEKE